MHIRSTALAAGLAVLAFPIAADAATKTVQVGATSKAAPKDAGISGFYPRTTKVRVGDTVSFQLGGFGVAYLPGKGGKAPSIFQPDADRPVTGVKDAAGADFAFNGRPSILANMAVFAGGKGGAYDGSKAMSAGVPMGEGPPKPWKVKFTKPGHFKVYDAFHPGVSGTIHVVRKSAAVTSQKGHRRTAKLQIASDVKAVTKLAARPAPQGDVIVAGPDQKGLNLLRFTPAAKTIAVGKPLTLSMSSGSASDPHTFTFGKVEELAKRSEQFLAPLPGTGENGPPVLAFDPLQYYASDDGDTLTHTGANHGDGFLNTGMLDADSASPLPRSKQVVFTKPGTYDYLCMVHPDMRGKVTVTG